MNEQKLDETSQRFLNMIGKAKQVDRAADEIGSSSIPPKRAKLMQEGGRGGRNQMDDYYDDENDKEAMLEAKYQSMATRGNRQSTPQQMMYEQQQYVPQQQTRPNRSKVPSFIQQSIAENPLEFSDNPLDRIPIPERTIREQVTQASYAAAPQFDYSVMRAIINECLETKLKEHSMLTEGSPIKNILLQAGKIKIVDNKGNIYEANLKKVGNINDED